MMIKNCAIDFGNFNVKFIMAADKKGEPDYEKIFESGYTVSSRPTGLEWELQIGDVYLNFGVRQAVERDKTKSPRMMNCTLFCIACALEESGADPSKEYHINLATDLPIDLFGIDAGKYVDYYQQKSFTVILKGKTWNIVFNRVFAYAQGIVAWAAKQEDYENYSLMGILDIGGRTIDTAVIAYNQFTGEMSIVRRFSLQNGILDLYNQIDSELQRSSIQLPEPTIAVLIRGQKSFRHGMADLIQKVVKRESDAYAQDIRNNLFERKVDLTLPFLAMGGGSGMISDRLDLELVEDAGILANVKGCMACMLQELSEAC